jgi:hypothetical protein
MRRGVLLESVSVLLTRRYRRSATQIDIACERSKSLGRQICSLFVLRHFPSDPIRHPHPIMMIATSYSQATAPLTTTAPGHMNANSNSQWDQTGYSNPATSGSSDSSSSDDGGTKKKRKSHRPRGCRGGGSRKARKERRELQFLAQKRDNSNVTPFLPPMNNQQTSKNQDSIMHLQKMQLTNDFHPSVLRKSTDFIPALPALQSSSSFSSSGSSEAGNNDISYIHTNTVTQRSHNNCDILPSMPLVQSSSDSFDSGNSYRSMSALPPLAGAVSSTYNLPTHNSYPQQRVLPIGRTTGKSHSYNTNNNTSYHTERIKKQQDMLAGGGSLFATSPHSFLLGAKKAPCFF